MQFPNHNPIPARRPCRHASRAGRRAFRPRRDSIALICVDTAAALMAVVYTSYESGGLAISTSAWHSGVSCAPRGRVGVG